MDDFLSLGKLEEGLVEVNMESLSKELVLGDIDDLLKELIRHPARVSRSN